MKKSELVRLLKKAGCYLEKSGGKHDKWVNPKTGESDWIPRHSKEVSKGTAESVLKRLTK